MKKTALILLLLLAACDDRDYHAESVQRARKTEQQTLVDNGIVPIPDRPGYALHHYQNVIGDCCGNHHVYVLEKDGVPVAGADTTYRSGKTTQTVIVK